MSSAAATLAPLEAQPWERFDRPRAVPRDIPRGATITRQFSLWPFGTRILKLFLLCDPTTPDPTTSQALLRAMQQEYFRSEARSQTNALRSAILAAHYALRERNQEKLAHERSTAAAACAVTRGTTAYVALAGEAAALSWSDGALSMHRAPVRVARPLGADAVPRVVFWSTPLGQGDRLALVCGAAWKDDSADAIADVLHSPHEATREDLALLLAGSDGPARVWVAEGPSSPASRPRLSRAWSAAPFHSSENARAAAVGPAPGPSPRSVQRQWVIAAGALAAVSLAAVGARQGLDWRAHALQEQAPALAAAHTWRVADLGQAAGNVVDLVLGDDAAYALDVQGQAVRRFALSQGATSDASIAVRRGVAIGRGSLETPTAIAWIDDAQGRGQLLVLDRARNAVLIKPSAEMRRVELPQATEWQSIGAVEGGRDALYVLDRAAARIMAYDGIGSSDGPRVRDVVTRQSSPGLHLEDVDDLVWAGDLYLHYADGSVRRIDQQGRQQPFAVAPPDRRPGPIAGLAKDGSGGLYLLDSLNRDVLQVGQDGRFVRELSLGDAGALDAARLVQSTGDGQHLAFVDPAGISAVDLPAVSTPQVGVSRS